MCLFCMCASRGWSDTSFPSDLATASDALSLSPKAHTECIQCFSSTLHASLTAFWAWHGWLLSVGCTSVGVICVTIMLRNVLIEEWCETMFLIPCIWKKTLEYYFFTLAFTCLLYSFGLQWYPKLGQGDFVYLVCHNHFNFWGREDMNLRRTN